MAKRRLHCNSAGLIGGYSVCGKDKVGDHVVMRDEEVNCPECLDLMISYSLKKGWEFSPNMVAHQARKSKQKRG